MIFMTSVSIITLGVALCLFWFCHDDLIKFAPNVKQSGKLT